MVSLQGFVPVPALADLEAEARRQGWGLLVEDPGPDEEDPEDGAPLEDPGPVETVVPELEDGEPDEDPGPEEITVPVVEPGAPVMIVVDPPGALVPPVLPGALVPEEAVPEET